jgi:hypothetical protein
LAPQDEQARESGMMGVPKRNGATTQRALLQARPRASTNSLDAALFGA